MIKNHISGVLKFCTLCSVTLFFFSQHFVNEWITDKDIEAPSFTVTAIKNEMRQLIEVLETPTNEPAFVECSLKSSGNDKTRQGETPEGRSPASVTTQPIIPMKVVGIVGVFSGGEKVTDNLY